MNEIENNHSKNNHSATRFSVSAPATETACKEKRKSDDLRAVEGVAFLFANPKPQGGGGLIRGTIHSLKPVDCLRYAFRTSPVLCSSVCVWSMSISFRTCSPFRASQSPYNPDSESAGASAAEVQALSQAMPLLLHPNFLWGWLCPSPRGNLLLRATACGQRWRGSALPCKVGRLAAPPPDRKQPRFGDL